MRKKALITGSGGFVGVYLKTELESNGYDAIGMDVAPSTGTVQGDILNPEQMCEILREITPDAIFHLAGQASVARSWKIPQKTFEINVIGTVNLLEAAHQFVPGARIILVGSSDEYGSLGNAGAGVSEEVVLNPQTPYAVSKHAQEELAKTYVRAYGMHICMTRSFNHCGRGQKRGFLIPDFAAGIVDVETGKKDALHVGNLTAKRDFTHVKDIVRAYRLLAESGRWGEIYNVGSGMTWSAQEILDALRKLASCAVPVVMDPDKMRPSDTPLVCCDHGKLTADTGWMPNVSMEETLQEVLNEWRQKAGLTVRE